MDGNKKIRKTAILLAAFMFSALYSIEARSAGILNGESGEDPVVLVHGYSGSVLGQLSVEGYWIFIGSRLELDGYDTYKIALGDAALQDIRESAEELRDFVNSVLARTGKTKVDMVCHSEGGLVARYYIKNLGGTAFVDDLVTIATPHRGTTAASIGPGESARQMEVYSAFLRDLNSGDTMPGEIDYTAIHSNHDEMVFPQPNGFFEGAVNMNINLLGHAGIMLNEQVYQMVKGAVSTDLSGNHSDIPVKIMKDGMATNNPNVTVQLRKADHYHTSADMDEMRISNNQFMSDASWKGFSNTADWRIDTSMDGLKAVYVQYRRKGNILRLEMDKESPVYVDYIFYDSTAPEARIAKFPSVTLDRMISLKVEATDNSDNFKKFQVWNAMFAYGLENLGVKEMMLSADSGFSGAEWRPFSGEATVDLGEGAGQKTVYLKVRDGAGNESAVVAVGIRVVDPEAADLGMISEGDSDPVVMVHGYGGSIVGDVSSYINWVYIGEKLSGEGFNVNRVTLSDAGMQDVKKSADELKAFISSVLSDTGARKVDVVCHSEGGLVARYYIKNLGGAELVDDLVTISTPHRGTTVAAIGPGMAARQMEVASDFLRELNSGDTMPGDVEYTALFSHGDEIVLPGKNGFFDGAVNINYVVFGHAGILFHPDPYHVVRNSLANKYLFSKPERTVEILAPGMSTAAEKIKVKIHACNHYAPQTPVTEMMVSDSALFHGASWMPLSDYAEIDVAGAEENLLGVHVKFRGADGVESPSYADYIVIDRTAPDANVEITSVDTENSQLFIKIRVSDNTDRFGGLNLLNILESYGITDIGAREMRIGANENFDGAVWEPLEASKSFPFSPGAGRKNAYVQLRDAAGNESRVYSVSTYVFDKVNGYMALEDTKDPVVLVHGYGGSIAGDVSAYINWVYYVERLKAKGYSTHVIYLGNAAMQDIAVSAAELKDFVGNVLVETGAEKVDVICHSEGGLVARYYVQKLGGAAYVDDLVTIATPHRGTVMAGLGPGTAARQMEVGSGFMADLNGGDTTPGVVDYTSVFTNNDEMVVPPANGFFEGAVNVNTNFYEHATVLFNDEVFRAVEGALGLDIGHERTELPVYITKDRMVTSSTDVKLNLNYYNHNSPSYPPGEMKVSNERLLGDAEWSPVSASLEWKLEGGDGLKGIYVKFRAADSGEESPIYVDYIVLDREAPKATVSAAPHGKSGDTALLTITVSDNSDTFMTMNPLRPLESYGIAGLGVAGMMVWNSPDFTGAVWEAPSGSKVWPLLDGDGAKTVHLKFRDAAGNESEIYSVKVEEIVRTGTAVVTGEEAGDADEVIDAELEDFVTNVELKPGWNLVYLSNSLPERLKELIESTYVSIRDLFDLSRLDRPGELVNLPSGGRALWLHLDKNKKETINFRAPKFSSPHAYALAPGWNAIGTPGFSEVPVSGITVTYGQETMSLSEAEGRRLLVGKLYYYDLDRYRISETLLPYRAYFLMALQPCLLNIP